MTKDVKQKMSTKTTWNENVFALDNLRSAVFVVVFDNLKSAVFIVVFCQVYLTPSMTE